jgi:1,4-dihydroxy-2-naphthoate octaprenyltransferase
LKPGHFVAETDVTVDSEHAYARFTRRVQGVFIDAIIFMLILAVALMLAVWFASDHIARILGVTVAATWLFYEAGFPHRRHDRPLSVQHAGG